MGKKLLAGSGILIGLYLLLNYSTGTKDLLSGATTGGSNLVKALQGRS